MTTCELPDFGLEFTLPTCVEEMKQEEYLDFIRILATSGSEGWDEDHLCLELLYRLSPITKGANRLSLESAIALKQIADELRLLFITTTIDGKAYRVPRLETAKALVTEFMHDGVRYFGPQDALRTSNFSEFITSFYAFKDYVDTQDDSHLIKLLATLYRPGGEDLLKEYGDARKPFNKAHIASRMDSFKSLPSEYIKATKYFYSGFQQFLQDQKVRIGGSDISMQHLFQGGKKSNQSSQPDQGWIDVLFHLAESSVFGNVKETEEQSMWTIFSRLYQLHREAKEQERRSKKNSIK